MHAWPWDACMALGLGCACGCVCVRNVAHAYAAWLVRVSTPRCEQRGTGADRAGVHQAHHACHAYTGSCDTWWPQLGSRKIRLPDGHYTRPSDLACSLYGFYGSLIWWPLDRWLQDVVRARYQKLVHVPDTHTHVRERSASVDLCVVTARGGSPNRKRIPKRNSTK